MEDDFTRAVRTTSVKPIAAPTTQAAEHLFRQKLLEAVLDTLTGTQPFRSRHVRVPVPHLHAAFDGSSV